MSTQIKFIPCDEDEQVYHFHRTYKKAYQKDLNVVSLKNKPLKKGDLKKPLPKKQKGNPRKGKK